MVTGLGQPGPGTCHKGYYVDYFGRRIGDFYASNVVKGRSDLQVIAEGFYGNISSIWEEAGPEILRQVASVASNYPGVGTVVAVGASFLAEVGEGASLGDASLAAARSAIPSALTAVYDIGVGLATQGNLNYEAAMKIALATAISESGLDGAVLQKMRTIKDGYDTARAIGIGV
jgi:hypothetical protein